MSEPPRQVFAKIMKNWSKPRRLRQIADALDNANAPRRRHLLEADRIVERDIVEHEREDEETVYPRVSTTSPRPRA